MASDSLPLTTKEEKEKDYIPKPLQWVSIQSADASGQTLIKHPRDGHIIFDPRKIIVPSEIYDDLSAWYTQNVADYLKYPDRWSGYLRPDKMLMVWGPAGMGRSVYTAAFCKRNGINLIYVTSIFYSSSRIMASIELAKKHQPCILYFDNANYIFDSKDLLSSLYACFKGSVNLRDTQMWCVLSFDSNLLTLPEMANNMIDEFGTVVKCLPPLKPGPYTNFIPYIVNSIVGNDQLTTHSSWSWVLSRFTSAAAMCTFREIYNVFLQIVVRHRKKQGTHEEFTELQPSDLTKALDTLPVLYNDPTATLSSTDCEKRFEDITSMWSTYLQTKGPNFSSSSSSSSSSSTSSTPPSAYHLNTTRQPPLPPPPPPPPSTSLPLIPLRPLQGGGDPSSSFSLSSSQKHPRSEPLGPPSRFRFQQPETRACVSSKTSLNKKLRVQKQTTYIPDDYDDLLLPIG